MKKLLIGTAAAALFASPAVAGPIDIGVAGYFNQMFQMVDLDKSHTSGGNSAADYNLAQDAEVFFKGKGTTDGGLTIGVDVQLEASQSGDQIDEHYMYIQGGFGKLVLGAENSAARMLQAGLSTYSGVITGEDNFLLVNGVGYTHGTVNTQITGDADKITYISPSISGLQVGFSLTPTVDPTTGSGLNNVDSMEHGAGEGEATSYGIRYKGMAGPAKIAVSVTGESHDEGGAGTAGDGSDEDSAMGLSVMMNGFELAYAANTREKTKFGSNNVTMEEEFTNTAISYKVNDKLKIGLDMQSDEVTAGGDKGDTYEHTRFGASYMLGKGMKLHFSNVTTEDLDKSTNEKEEYTITNIGIFTSF